MAQAVHVKQEADLFPSTDHYLRHEGFRLGQHGKDCPAVLLLAQF